MPIQTSYPYSPGGALPGQLACRYNEAEIDSFFSAEGSAEIPFGFAVKWGSTTNGKLALLPAAETDKIVGIVVHSHDYEISTQAGELGTTGVKPGGPLNVLRKGVIWVVAEDAVQPGQRLWVRCTAGGDAAEKVGGCVNADEGTETIDCTAKGEWLTAAAAGELAKLRINF